MGTPTCPRCLARPRHTGPSGRVWPYCKPCTNKTQNVRKGHVAAEKTCSICGGTYNGKSRANVKALVCPACRCTCPTCGKPKSPGDRKHTECARCRAAGKLCQQCQINPPLGNNRLCWQCITTSDDYSTSPAKHRDRLYGLAPGQYDQMLAEQNGLCAISGQPEGSIRSDGKAYPLAVDHDRACCPGNRSCGKCVRGLVTRNINVGLGMFGDDPALLRAAADYIEHHRARSG